VIEQRARLLRAAVGFALAPPTEPERRLLHRWLDCWAGTLVAVSLFSMLMVLPDAQAHASETCVEDSRAALATESPRAFGPETIVDGPKTIATVELELRAERLLTDQDQYPEWEQLKRLVRSGDCLMFFRSSPYSWEHAFGSEGYVLVREGKIVRDLPTKIQ
jgi:hypothetical protein